MSLNSPAATEYTFPTGLARGCEHVLLPPLCRSTFAGSYSQVLIIRRDPKTLKNMTQRKDDREQKPVVLRSWLLFLWAGRLLLAADRKRRAALQRAQDEVRPKGQQRHRNAAGENLTRVAARCPILCRLDG